MPGYRNVAVDSMGRVLGDDSEIRSQPGDTLVTSIDAKVQSVVERQLADAIAVARATVDPVTGRHYAADSGAAIVLEADTGRVVAMASQPTYDPSLWVGGITKKQLSALYSEKAGTPLLGRATQGQFAPGSTWKPFMTAGALTNGYSTDTQLNCSSSLHVGNRDFKNYESGAYGYITFAKALEVSCNTFFYRVGYDFWQRFGSDVADVNAKDPLVAEAKEFGFGTRDRASTCRARRRAGSPTGSGSAPTSSRRRTTTASWPASRRTRRPATSSTSSPGSSASRATPTGPATPSTSRSARATRSSRRSSWPAATPRSPTAAPSTRRGSARRSWRPTARVIRRIAPKKVGEVDVPDRVIGYIDEALKDVTRQGTMAWKMGGFPLDEVVIRSKTGSAEVYGKQSTSWVASYSDDYVVVMMVSQGGTGSGTSGPGVRAIWESLYGINGEQVVPGRAAIPGMSPRRACPTSATTARSCRPLAPQGGLMRRIAALDWVLLAAVLGLSVLGALLVWSATSTRDDLTGGDPTAYLWKQVVNIAIGLVLLAAVLRDRPPVGADRRAPRVRSRRWSAWCWC